MPQKTRIPAILHPAAGKVMEQRIIAYLGGDPVVQ